jgi:hypothetical protein
MMMMMMMMVKKAAVTTATISSSSGGGGGSSRSSCSELQMKQGAHGSVVVKALCYKPEGHGIASR